MSNVLSVTAPIYLLILVGYVAVWLGWMVPTDLRVLGRFVAQFCVPALLFRALSRQPFAEVLHGDYVAVYAGGSLVALATVTLFARFVRGRPMSLAALQGLGSSGSNSSFVGYPIVEQLIGPTAGVALAMADSEGGGGRPRDALMAALRGLVRNPMILAILAGLALSASGLHLPSVLDRTVAIAAAAAPPTALFVIGGSLVGLRLAGIRGDLALVTFGKLAFHPLCVLGFMLVLPIRDPALRAAAVLFAAMPMLSIYPVLAQKHGHERFCAAALLAATVVSFVSISALIGIIPVWQGTR
jgi:predicted permease